MRYKVTETFIFVHKINGQRVSPYGAAPEDLHNWSLVSDGYTLCDAMRPGIIGVGHQPSKTIEDAQLMCDEWNKRDIESAMNWRKSAIAHALASPNVSDKAIEWAAKSLAAKKQPEMRYSKKVNELAEKEAFKMLRENKSKDFCDVKDAYFDAAFKAAQK